MKLLTLITLLSILIVAHARAQAPVPNQQRIIIKAWDECGESILKENALITELTKSFQLNPPWRVTDAHARCSCQTGASSQTQNVGL